MIRRNRAARGRRRCQGNSGFADVTEVAAALEDVEREVRRERAAVMNELMLQLLRSDRVVRELEVDEQRGSVLLTVGDLTVRASVPAPAQWREAETAAQDGGLRLAAVAPINVDQTMLGFRAEGVPILAIANTAVEQGS